MEKTSRQPVAFAVDDLSIGRPHGCVEHIPRTEDLATTLAGAMPGRDRIRPVHPGLDRPLIRVEQPVADDEGADLVEVDVLRCHDVLSVELGSDEANVAKHAFGMRAGTSACVSTDWRSDQIGSESEEVQLVRIDPARVDLGQELIDDAGW